MPRHHRLALQPAADPGPPSPGNGVGARRRAPAAPEPAALTVLKFGSSVLARPDDYRAAAEVVAAEAARGRKVVAVVSAMGRTTDTLLAAARSVTAAAPQPRIGALLATGEAASAALLTLALRSLRVRATLVSASPAPIRTRGPLDDADPVHVDTGRIRAAFGRCDALVFPGFVGRDVSGAPSLLGRGGSDLTALFLGDALGASEIRLVKDAPGIFPQDPGGREGLLPHAELKWDAARRIGGGVVVQAKALDYAERRGVCFRVTGLAGAGTRVGEPRRPRAGGPGGSAVGR